MNYDPAGTLAHAAEWWAAASAGTLLSALAVAPSGDETARYLLEHAERCAEQAWACAVELGLVEPEP